MTKFELLSHTSNRPQLRLIVVQVSCLNCWDCLGVWLGCYSLPKTLHRKRRIGACDRLHPILYIIENKTKQYCTVAQEHFFFQTHTSKYSIKQEETTAENVSAHKILKYVHLFYIFHFHYKRKNKQTKSIQVHHFLICTVLTVN